MVAAAIVGRRFLPVEPPHFGRSPIETLRLDRAAVARMFHVPMHMLVIDELYEHPNVTMIRKLRTDEWERNLAFVRGRIG